MPHIHEKIDFTTSVYIVHGDAVLLRYHEKYDMWCAPGGHIELDEDPNQAAVREAREETGLTVTLAGTIPNVTEGEGYKALIPPRFLNIHHTSETHQHCDLVYLGTAETRTLAPAEGEAETEMRWFNATELDDAALDLRETVRHYALTALEELGTTS